MAHTRAQSAPPTKVLRLPRNLDFSIAPATKPALQGPPSAAPATKSTLQCQGPESTAPATKPAFQGPPSAAPATKSTLQCHSPGSAAPATKSTKHCACQNVCTSRFTSRNPAKAIRTKSTSKQHPDAKGQLLLETSSDV